MGYKFFLILTLSYLTCTHSEERAGHQSDSTAIERVYKQFSLAYEKLDHKLVKALYEENAIYLDPGQPIQFKQSEFINSFADMFTQADQEGMTLAIEFRIMDRKFVNSDTAIDVGYFRLRRFLNGVSQHENIGKFITVLRKQKDDSWRFIADAYNHAPLDAWSK